MCHMEASFLSNLHGRCLHVCERFLLWTMYIIFFFDHLLVPYTFDVSPSFYFTSSTRPSQTQSKAENEKNREVIFIHEFITLCCLIVCNDICLPLYVCFCLCRSFCLCIYLRLCVYLRACHCVHACLCICVCVCVCIMIMMIIIIRCYPGRASYWQESYSRLLPSPWTL